MPNFLRKALNYLDESTKWALAGRPVVSDEVRAYRRSQCDPCERRNKENDTCNTCGCALHPTTLGDKLGWATSQCPYTDAQGKPAPKWLAVWPPPEAQLIEEPFPTWRQVCIWIDDQGKPSYVDGLTLRMDDVIIQDAWLSKDPEKGAGFSRRYDFLHQLIVPNFTGTLDVIVGWELWKSTLQVGLLKADIKKGQIRFEKGKPVEVLCL